MKYYKDFYVLIGFSLFCLGLILLLSKWALRMDFRYREVLGLWVSGWVFLDMGLKRYNKDFEEEERKQVEDEI